MCEDKVRAAVYVASLRDMVTREGYTKDESIRYLLISMASYILSSYDRNEIPDWVEALANANPMNFDAALDEIQTMIKVEEEQ